MSVDMQTSAKDILDELVTANHILSNEDVVDVFGHVSVRDPQRPDCYFLSCSRSPGLVQRSDIMHFTLDSRPVGNDDREAYLERFIHGAIYEARPDINSVIHSHTDDVLPFTISDRPLCAVTPQASKLGKRVPVWDIDEHFGDGTDLLVRNHELGTDLAKALAGGNAVLMRGHGFAVAGASLAEAVSVAIFLPRNAKILWQALQMGSVKSLSDAEIAVMRKRSGSPRAWEYWSQRAER
jgi:ribulose-5-phosphate 4-epimerase/fuculose-1-phosphate aldolase